MDIDRPWWRQERRHLPPASSRNDELIERRHVLPVVHPVIDHFANIKPKNPPIYKEPRTEGVKRLSMPPVPDDRPQGISMKINASNYVPEKPLLRFKCSSPHVNAIAQGNRDIQAKLEKRMGEKKHRESLEERNMLAYSSQGDKAYKRPECSPGYFHLQLHPRHLAINNNAIESSRRVASPDDGGSGHVHLQTSYELKKKVQMLHQEKAGVSLLSASKAGQLSWEEATGNRTWVKKDAPPRDSREEDG
ncbi:Aste57867_846 [Aphanomyces stellatus]|uniref:Aste57867_846 protein n=1 Tax=Aphanomyces stellatus TaxID=120398 RepID=A0A485K4W6_9STRA|nr:hypothetical protein As57867_000845 [Aphanomyces stellatus]VFT78070.1 Aste57867_846 [Aphanomyces stellatus]